MAQLIKSGFDAISSLPGWQQDVVGGLVLAFLLGFFPSLQWIIRTCRLKLSSRKALRQQKEAEQLQRAADEAARRYQPVKAGIGFVDHAINASKGWDKTTGSLRAGAQALELSKQLIIKHAAPHDEIKEKGLTGDLYFEAKRQAHENAAKDFSVVLKAVAECATQSRVEADKMMAGYKALLQLPINNQGAVDVVEDRRRLMGLLREITGRYSPTFQQAAQIYRKLTPHSEVLGSVTSPIEEASLQLLRLCDDLRSFSEEMESAFSAQLAQYRKKLRG